MLQRIATWYLKRKGLTIIPRTFRGVVLGNCQAIADGDTLHVSMPPRGAVVAMNHSVATLAKARWL